MSSTRTVQALKFDIESAAFMGNPFATFAAMRAGGPVIRVKLPMLGPVWLTTTHAATLALVKDNETFVQEGRHAGKSGVAGLQWWMPKTLRTLTNHMLLKDEPDHRRLRKLVDSAFARRDIQTMRGRIEAIADRLLDDLQDRAEVDLSRNFAERLPLEVICELLGLPDGDRAMFVSWTRKALQVNSTLDLFNMVGPLNKLMAYLRNQIEERRRAPRPGLISDLVRDEDGDKLNEEELLSMIFLLLVAGFVTTTHLVADSIIVLEQNPEQKALLLADPANRMERAVEELGRFTTPVQMTKPKWVARDTEFFGQPMRRGDMVMAFLAAANADPAVFAEPQTLDLDRFPNPHLVFSSGIHFCLGMQLARVETQSALTRLFARFPDLQLAHPDDLPWMKRFGIRGVQSLPVRLTPTPMRRAA